MTFPEIEVSESCHKSRLSDFWGGFTRAVLSLEGLVRGISDDWLALARKEGQSEGWML